MTSGQTTWLQAPGHTLAVLTAGHGQTPAIALAACCVLTGAGIFADRLTLTTGQATDPNTGPLLILLAACLWPPRTRLRASGGTHDGA
jgi:hypothetical protein